MTFTLPELPYSYDALQDFGMSRETLEYHHDIHHKAYADNGNKAVAETKWVRKTVEEIILENYVDGSVSQNGLFNNASQFWNHCLFWDSMVPGGTKMPGNLEKELISAFGTINDFKIRFVAAGVTQFGSGWCWLVKNSVGTLEITKTENGVNPMCFGQKPLLGCDVWEHSYYIDYRNKRPDYVGNFLENLVNWEFVAGRL